MNIGRYYHKIICKNIWQISTVIDIICFQLFYVKSIKVGIIMGKIYKDGYDFFFWNYEGQTKMKHEVLEEYVDKWVKIVGCYHKLNYFDCFGGCGAYIENDNIYYGSPIRVAEAVLFLPWINDPELLKLRDRLQIC